MSTAVLLLVIAGVYVFVLLPALIGALYLAGGRRASLTAKAPSAARDRVREAQAAEDRAVLAEREGEFR